jgi:hypothetical protein
LASDEGAGTMQAGMAGTPSAAKRCSKPVRRSMARWSSAVISAGRR